MIQAHHSYSPRIQGPATIFTTFYALLLLSIRVIYEAMFQYTQTLHHDRIGLLSCPFYVKCFVTKSSISLFSFEKQITNCSYHFTTVIQSDRNDANFAPSDPFSTSTSLYLYVCLCPFLCLSLSVTHTNEALLLFYSLLPWSQHSRTYTYMSLYSWFISLGIFYPKWDAILLMSEQQHCTCDTFFIPSYTAGRWLEHT